jgi:hypothetical protein
MIKNDQRQLEYGEMPHILANNKINSLLVGVTILVLANLDTCPLAEKKAKDKL